MRLLALLDQLPPWAAALLALGLVAGIGAGDGATSGAFDCSLLYLFPILLVSWTASRRVGMLVAAAAAGVWLLTDLWTSDRTGHPLLPYGSALMHFVVLALTDFLLRAFKYERIHARIDPLTEIPNRQAFFERAALEGDRSRRHHQPLTMVYLDCDDFKRVNDRHGHGAGDALLRLVARVLAQNVRSTDFTARLGGDEFALLLVGSGAPEAMGTLEKLRRLLLDSMRLQGWGVTFSIGAATFPQAPEGVEEMLQTVDALMYEAKKGGKNAIRLQLLKPLTGDQPLALDRSSRIG